MSFSIKLIIVSLAGSFITINTALANTVSISLSDQKGKPLNNAVVSLKPLIGNTASKPSDSASIAQVNKEFVPEVSVIQAGTAIKFPNKDDILHHVYSFSKTKVFDLPLYRGTPAEPVIFDTPGLVTLGCNIHDWMRAYVVVVDTPYYKISAEDGSVSLSDMPTGQYELEIWHPRQRKMHKDSLEINEDFSLSLKIATKPQLRSRRNSAGGKGIYDK